MPIAHRSARIAVWRGCRVGVSGRLVGPAAFKAVEALYPQRLVGSIPIHSRAFWSSAGWAVAPRITGVLVRAPSSLDALEPRTSAHHAAPSRSAFPPARRPVTGLPPQPRPETKNRVPRSPGRRPDRKCDSRRGVTLRRCPVSPPTLVGRRALPRPGAPPVCMTPFRRPSRHASVTTADARWDAVTDIPSEIRGAFRLARAGQSPGSCGGLIRRGPARPRRTGVALRPTLGHIPPADSGSAPRNRPRKPVMNPSKAAPSSPPSPSSASSRRSTTFPPTPAGR